MKKMLLNIQLFAEEGVVETPVPENNGTTNSSDNGQTSQEPLKFTDLLSSNKDYQKEFDRLVSKSLDTAKAKWEKDYTARIERERSEAEKLAQMDADQKMQYELDKANSEKEALQNELNAINLYKKASEIASDKDLPIGYLDLVDFSRETAESITDKIEKIQELRQKDLQAYLNNKLRQDAPQEKRENDNYIDPYIEGFLSEM